MREFLFMSHSVRDVGWSKQRSPKSCPFGRESSPRSESRRIGGCKTTRRFDHYRPETVAEGSLTP